MNQYVFAARNIRDKLSKIVSDRDMLRFYWRQYVLGAFESVDPSVYVVSYPKCGRTWLRVIMRKYLDHLGLSVQRFASEALLGAAGYPTVKFDHDKGDWVPAPLRVDRLRFDAKKYESKKVIFLTRDPRDVLVSSWNHLRFREPIYREDLSAFVRDDLVGVRKVVAFMNMWVEHREVPQAFHLVTYEEMHEDAFGATKEALRFAGFPQEEEALRKAVEESSFDRMKRMEQEGARNEAWMKPGATGDRRSAKVRKGKVGGHRQELAADDIAFIDRVLHKELSAALPYAK